MFSGKIKEVEMITKNDNIKIDEDLKQLLKRNDNTSDYIYHDHKNSRT
jgi:hypothetical protein